MDDGQNERRGVTGTAGGRTGGGARQAGVTMLGAYAPERILTNADLEAMMDTSDEWITTRTGIKRRHIAAEDEFTSDLAMRAVEDLVARHGDDALADVDMVILATNTPDALFPSTAALVQDRFGLKAAAFDLLAACPGWIYGLGVANLKRYPILVFLVLK